jgi:hypothetical protein
MEPTPSEKVEVGSEDKAKKKRSGWSTFFNFLAAGGFMLVIIGGVVLAFVINLIINKLTK